MARGRSKPLSVDEAWEFLATLSDREFAEAWARQWFKTPEFFRDRTDHMAIGAATYVEKAPRRDRDRRNRARNLVQRGQADVAARMGGTRRAEDTAQGGQPQDMAPNSGGFRFDLRVHDEPEPIVLTPEQLEVAKKTLGLDAHASEVIARVQNEAKTAREQLEAVKADVTSTKTELAAAQKKANDAEEARKALETQLASKTGDLDTAIKNMREETDKKIKELKESSDQAVANARTEGEQRQVKTAAKAALTLAGIIDPVLLSQFEKELKDKVKVEDGEVVGLDDFLKAAKEAKPHFFDETKARARDDNGRFTTRPAVSTKAGDFDWSTLRPGSPEWEAKERELLGARA